MRARILLLLVLSAWFADAAAYRPGYVAPEAVEGATTIDVQRAKQLHDAGTVFVDVRNPRLYARRHIPGAVHLDLAKSYSADNLAAVVGKDQPFVVYCSGVKCSRISRAAERAVRRGFTAVHYFRGGIVDWRDAGFPMAHGE